MPGPLSPSTRLSTCPSIWSFCVPSFRSLSVPFAVVVIVGGGVGLSACGGGLEGTPCEDIGAEACEETALFRCNGEEWLKQGDCSWQCLEGAAPNVHTEVGAGEVWSCEDGPHVVSGVLTVPDGQTLTVAAGAEIRIERGGRIDTTASSAVVAEGTEGTPILVTSDDGTGGGFGAMNQGGLNLFARASAADASHLAHVIVERGLHGISVLGLSAENVAPVLEGCTFRDNEGWGVLVRGCQGEVSIPDYEGSFDNRFFENGEGAVSSCQ